VKEPHVSVDREKGIPVAETLPPKEKDKTGSCPRMEGDTLKRLEEENSRKKKNKKEEKVGERVKEAPKRNKQTKGTSCKKRYETQSADQQSQGPPESVQRDLRNVVLVTQVEKEDSAKTTKTRCGEKKFTIGGQRNEENRTSVQRQRGTIGGMRLKNRTDREGGTDAHHAHLTKRTPPFIDLDRREERQGRTLIDQF